MLVIHSIRVGEHYYPLISLLIMTFNRNSAGHTYAHAKELIFRLHHPRARDYQPLPVTCETFNDSASEQDVKLSSTRKTCVKHRCTECKQLD